MNITFLILWEKSSHPNLGVLYLASYIEKYSKAEHHFVYLEQEKFNISKLKNTKPDVVAITSVTPNFLANSRAAMQIKEELDIPVLMGGPHITSLPNSLPDYVDIGIMGEGEETVLDLLNRNFEYLENVPGIVYYEDKIKINPRRQLIEPLDNIPPPKRDLLDKSYFEKQDILTTHEKLRGCSFVTSRGCPYSCIYCQSKTLWPKARFHSGKYVADEIIMLKEKYKVEALAIDDDLFIMNKERLKEIITRLEEAKILGEIKFNCTGRANLMDDELLGMLKKMGVVQVNLGVESGSEKVLNYLKRNSVTVEQNQKAVDLIHKYNMQAYCSFMLGNPGETKEDMLKTFEFYKRNNIETATLNITTPLPGTELWDISKEKGLVKDDTEWEGFFNSLRKPETNIYINDVVPHDEFLKIYKEFQQEIYKRAALSWKGLTMKDAIKSAIKDPRKSFNFLIHNFRDIPKIFSKKKGVNNDG